MGMRVLLLSSSENGNSISPHVQNAKEMHKHLGWDLVWDVEREIIDALMEQQYDAIMFIHATGREKSRIMIDTLVDRYLDRGMPLPEFYFFKNDYDLGENHGLWALCRDHDVEYTMIANFHREGELRCMKYINDWTYVNINTLLYNEVDRDWRNEEVPITLFAPENNYGLKQYGLFYWGQYRKDRIEGFQRYVDKRFFFSTSRKNMPKFKRHFDANFVNRVEAERFVEFKYTLYVEDVHTHKHFNNLANRYYEALMYDIIMFFDSHCMDTLKIATEQAGYQWHDIFIVHNKEELHDKVALLESDRRLYDSALAWQAQNKPYAMAEKVKTLKQINEIVNN
jgi:hypothetical protein